MRPRRNRDVRTKFDVRPYWHAVIDLTPQRPPSWNRRVPAMTREEKYCVGLVVAESDQMPCGSRLMPKGDIYISQI